jgi:type II secretory pathway component PulJ
MIRPTALKPGAAFTLVELMIGSALSAAIMAAVLSSYIFLGRSLGRLANQQTLETESRRALAYFTQDVQSATGFSSTITPANYRLALTISTGTSSVIVTYYYNSTALSASAETDDVTVNGVTVKMRRQSLTRCVYNNTSVVSQTLVRNITDNDAGTSADLFFRYYDSAGNAYDSGSSPYTTVTTYSTSGIRQVTLQFSLQAGAAGNGTQTVVNQITSGRVALHNKPYLQ